MKALIFFVAIILIVSAQNDIQGPGNIIKNGKDNHVKGKFNSINGYTNKILGNLNSIRGDSNNVEGSKNFVIGDDNLVLGAENFVFGENNQISDFDAQIGSQSQNYQWVENIQSQINEKFNRVSDQIKEITEGMRKRILDKFQHRFTEEMKKKFQENFHQQTKLGSIDLQKLKKMRPGNHRM